MADTPQYREAATKLNPKKKDDDDVMEKIIHHVGEMGTYQRWLVVAMLPFMATWCFGYALQMFIAATPQDHWCRVPELMNLSVEVRRNLSIPWSAESGWERCVMFDANYSQVLVALTAPRHAPVVPCRDGWEFLFDDIPYSTVINEREWVCDRAAHAPFAQSMYFVGSLLGTAFFGWLGDAFGRLPAFIGANILGLVGNLATIFTVGRWDFALARLIAGTASEASYVMIYIIILEFIGSRHRTWVTNVAFVVGGAGALMLTPALALWLKNWRMLVIVTSCPALLALATPWFVPESVRWLASTGKVNRALSILKRFERINKREIPQDVIDEFVISSKRKVETDESLGALFRSPQLRRCILVLLLTTMLIALGLDAVIRMSENIGTDFFVTFAASSLAEVPALALVTVTLDRFGRRAVIVATFGLASVFSFICAFIPRGVSQTLAAVSLRFAVNMAASALSQLAPETLPTSTRSAGNSLVHLAASTATVISPYVVYSGSTWRPLPLLIVGALSVLGASAAMLLPETSGRALPHSVADAERLVARNVLCGRAEFDDDAEEITTLKEKV